MKCRRFLATMVVVLALLVSVVQVAGQGGGQQSPQAPPSYSFTYQGQLRDASGPVNATCNLQFTLWDANVGGSQVGNMVLLEGVPLQDGLFTARLDFGATAFRGQARYLEVAASCPVGSAFVPLPRQELTASPYALYALSAWSQTGNAGTTPGTNFLGTSDNAVLELKVNGARALRLEPNATSPNLLGGYSGNQVTAGVSGATIGGGGSSGWAQRVTDNYGTVSGGTNNRAGDNAGTVSDASYATVGGGLGNTAQRESATIGGGAYNNVLGVYGTVAGGDHNHAYANNSTVAGGGWNEVTGGGSNAFIGGGYENSATAPYATVGGGSYNNASASHVTVGGGWSNAASVQYATVGGGYDNTASNEYTTVGGGSTNTASQLDATVAGGSHNTASGARAAVGGGYANTASGENATVGGGAYNTSSGFDATVAGGEGNSASGDIATVAGGSRNSATAQLATIGGGGDDQDPDLGNRVTDNWGTVGGGRNNQAGDDAGTTEDHRFATVGGGRNNTASGTSSVVAGGDTNTASDTNATVGGGAENFAIGGDSTVGGGYDNKADGFRSTVGGGYSNLAIGQSATVSGGWNNIVTGNAATVPGGADNTADGGYSFAAGAQAHAFYNGSFVWSSGTATYDWAPRTFTARSHGGVRFYTADGTSTGVQLGAGGTSWGSISDRNAKEAFAPVDTARLLEVLASMPVQTWNLKSQAPEVRRIGPVAQDFNGRFAYLFGEVESPIHINTMDAVGVSLGAAQGLYQRSQGQAVEIAALQAENRALQDQVNDLAARLAALEAGRGTGGSPARLPAGWLLLGGGVAAVGTVAGRRARGGKR